MCSTSLLYSVSSNNLRDEDQLGYLALCPSLVSVTLEGNPLSIMLAETTVSWYILHSTVCPSFMNW